MKYEIFVSYRRTGGREFARLIQQTLQKYGYRVFFDYDSLQDDVFNENIFRAIEEVEIFILVLTPGSMSRCVNEDDWVRKEIEHAIKMGKKIVPVNIDNQFDGFPPSLELGEFISQIQYSKLDMGELYEVSFELMINKRIKPTLTPNRRCESCSSSVEEQSRDKDGAVWRDEYGAIYSEDRKVLIEAPDVQSYKVCYGTERIADYAFNNLASLRSVEIPNSVLYLGEGVFANCDKLAAITLPGSINKIPKFCCTGCKSLKSVMLPDSIISIGDGAFTECSLLNRIVIPQSVTMIGVLSFSKCNSLRSVDIPSSVESVGMMAFSECKSLKEVSLSSRMKSIEEYLFLNCESLREIVIPNRVVTIEGGAFSGCKALKSVVMSNSVEKIRKFAFSSCISLKTISLSAVVVIGELSFVKCKALCEVEIGERLCFVGNQAFLFCESLRKFTLSRDGGSIVDKVQSRYNAIKSEDRGCCTVEERSIGEDAFMYCGSLSNVEFPPNITKIKKRAFAQCKVKSLIVPDSVVVIEDYAFGWCEMLQSVTLPDSLESLGVGVFTCCSSLENVVIPKGVKEVSNSIFSFCESLRRVLIPEGVLKIASEAFVSCAIEKIVIPKSVKLIEKNCFVNCKSLNAVNIKGENCVVEQRAFLSTAITSITVPRGAVERLKIELPKYSDLITEEVEEEECDFFEILYEQLD